MATTLCDDCKASGMAILPVRYAVVPQAMTPALPAWAGADRIKGISPGSEFHYALRTLRSGFVYLFYAKNAFGSNQWETYAVTQDGLLVKQPTPAMAKPVATLSCSRQGHSDTRLRHIVIQRPEKCGPTWIAFSEHAWSDETIQAYTDNSKLRNARMQTIHPSAMASGSKHSHGAVADVGALEDVLEYTAVDTSKLPHDSATGTFSKEDGSFTATRLVSMSTRTPWHLRKGQAEQEVRAMQERGRKPDGGSNTPHVLALWDAIGITHELNGYRNDAAGWLKKYGDERELQISALNAIEGTKKALEKKVNEGWDQVAKNTANLPDTQTSGMRNRAVMQHAKGDPSALGGPLYELDEKLRAGGITLPQHQAQRTQIFQQHSNNPAAMESAYKEIDAQRAHRDAERNRNLANNKQNDTDRSWARYEAKLAKASNGETTAHQFKNKWDGLVAQADTIIDRRTEALVRWLESPLLIDTLEDFHPNSIRDGVLFEDAVGDAIFGIGSSTSGAAKIEAWVKEAKASVKGNLVWRAIALNQEQGIAEVDAALKVAFGSQSKLTEAAWANVGAQVKWNKVADLYKKAVSLSNANVKAGVTPVNTRGVDKVLMTIGDKAFKPIAKVLDTINEKTLQSLFLLRSGAGLTATLALVEAQARHEGVSRARLVQRINSAKTFVTPELTAERKVLNDRWAALKNNADVPDAKGTLSAVKEARLALVVAVLEGVNLWKISQSVSNDPKVQWQLRAAQMATSAACVDVAATAIKGASALKDTAVSFQLLKVAGGLLSAGASFIGGALDWRDGNQKWNGSEYAVAALYFGRATFQFISGSLTILTAISYADPLLKQLVKRYAASTTLNIASRLSGWALAARAGLMLGGLGFSLATLAISLAIWYFTDDALQNWCEESAFGMKPQKKRFNTADEQMKAFEKAFVEVM